MPRPFELPAPGRRLDLPGASLGHGTDPAGGTGVPGNLCPEGAVATARGSTTLVAQGLDRLAAVAERRRA